MLYPFLAEQGLGSEGMLIGTDAFTQAAFCFDPWTLYEKGVVTNPNIALAGVIGTGKSSIMKCLALRGMATGKRTYIPGDVKGGFPGSRSRGNGDFSWRGFPATHQPSRCGNPAFQGRDRTRYQR